MNSAAIPTSVSGFSFDNSSGLLEGNQIGFVRFDGTGGSQVLGIRASIILGDTLRVFNNFISGVQRGEFAAVDGTTTLYAQGIWIFRQTGGGGLIQAFHNTIVMPASAAPVAYSSAGFHLGGGSTGKFAGELRNNIIVNRLSTSTTTQEALAVVDGNTAAGNLTSDYNVLLATGTNGAIGQTGRELGGTRVTSTTLADWQTNSTYDTNSVSRPVSFVDELGGDLRLAGASVGDQNLAAPALAAVPLDIDDDARGLVVTYRGAHEASVLTSTRTAQAAQLRLQAYPNPTTGYLVVDYQQHTAGSTRFVVLDAVGRQVHAVTGPDQPEGPQRQELDLGGLAAGIYLVQVSATDANGAPTSAAVRVSIVQ